MTMTLNSRDNQTLVWLFALLARQINVTIIVNADHFENSVSKYPSDHTPFVRRLCIVLDDRISGRIRNFVCV
jgi:hypothetical protein